MLVLIKATTLCATKAADLSVQAVFATIFHNYLAEQSCIIAREQVMGS